MKEAERTSAVEWTEGDLCSWRYRGKKGWQRSHVLGVVADLNGSIKVWNKRTGFVAYVPNDPACIKKRRR